MKVFVTVGSMLPFDRLVKHVDLLAGRVESQYEFFAQIGSSSFQPRNMLFEKMLTPEEFRLKVQWSDVILSHAGMGTLITAAECNKILLALPRNPDLGEVTSDHQIATAKWLRSREGVTIIDHEERVEAALLAAQEGKGVELHNSGMREALVSALRDFIFD
jgi:UDP-N-acetylglucosamine transferase subunit ALG13